MARLSMNIWALCYISFLVNIASVTVNSLSPIFLVSVLGADMTEFGIIKGIAEAFGYLIRISAGIISDYIGKRKSIVLIGYLCSFILKPVFATTTSIMVYTSAQICERLFNGVRDTPRDALIADYAPPGEKARCFGMRNSFATAGALLGAILTTFIMYLSNENYRLAFWLACFPVGVACIILIFLVKDSKNVPCLAIAEISNKASLTSRIMSLGYRYWILMFIIALCMMARFNDSFLVLRASGVGIHEDFTPLALAVMNLSYSIACYVVSITADKISRLTFLWIGMPFLAISYLCLISLSQPIVVMGILFYGVHMGCTQSIFLTIISDITPKDMRATSFGIFSVVCGIAAIIAIPIGGYVSQKYGLIVAFELFALLSVITTFALVLLRPSWYQHYK